MPFSNASLLNIGNRQVSVPSNSLSQSSNPIVDANGVSRYGSSIAEATRYGLGAIAQSPGSCSYGLYASALDRSAIAIGPYTVARLAGAIAIGDQPQVLSAFSVGIGTRSLVSTPYSILIGPMSKITPGTTAIGGQILIGFNSVNSGDNAISLGEKTKVTGDYGVAIGSQADVLSLNGIAIGNFPIVAGIGGIAIGATTIIGADYAMALGYGSASSFTNSISIGRNTITDAANQIKLGNVTFPLQGQVFGLWTNDITDAVTATVTVAETLIHRSSGAPAAGFGTGLSAQLHSSNNTLRTAGQLSIEWSTSTNASEDADFVLRLMAGGVAQTEKFRVTKSGDIKTKGYITQYNNASPADGQLIIGDTAGARFVAANLTAGTGISIANAAGSITISTSSSIATIASTVARLAQTADIGATNFSNASSAGTYRCSYYLVDVGADVAAGAVQVTFSFTDANGATTVVSAAVALTGIGTVRTSGVFFIQQSSGNVSYSTSHTGIFGTATYSLYICLERLS